jgi:hypothetical protein
MLVYAITHSDRIPYCYKILHLQSMITIEDGISYEEAWNYYKSGKCYDHTCIFEQEVKRRRTGEKPIYKVPAIYERINNA